MFDGDPFSPPNIRTSGILEWASVRFQRALIGSTIVALMFNIFNRLKSLFTKFCPVSMLIGMLVFGFGFGLVSTNRRSRWLQKPIDIEFFKHATYLALMCFCFPFGLVLFSVLIAVQLFSIYASFICIHFAIVVLLDFQFMFFTSLNEK